MGTAYTPPPLEGDDPAPAANDLTARPSWLRGPVDPSAHSPDTGARGLFQQIPTTFVGTGVVQETVEGVAVTITNDRNGTNVEFTQPTASDWALTSRRHKSMTELLRELS